MNLITIALFFIYTYGFGYATTYFLKKPDNFLEKNLMRIGFGLGILPIFMVLMGFLRIPLDWKIMLILSVIFPAYSAFNFFRKKEKPSFSIKIKKSDFYIFAAFILFLLSLFMYAKGAFMYPYLEDDDSWSHANGVKYVSIEKSVLNPGKGTGYLDPYPPAYDGLLGLLHQTSPSLMWTMKFFNALIISLSVLFFYFFSKEFIGSKKKALFATFVLASIPAFLSHFIWAHSMIPVLIILAFYSLEMIKYDKKYIFASALLIGSIFVTQPTQPIKFSVMFAIYFIVKFVYNRRLSLQVLSAGALGFITSLIWWITRWKSQLSIWSKPVEEKIAASGVTLTLMERIVSFFGVLGKAFDPGSGTATRVYSFGDFFVAKHQNMINNPVGIGIFISLLLVLSLIFIIIKYKTIFKKDHQWVLISLLWLIFTFFGINSLTFNLPIGLFAFRFWMLFAIPVALLSTLGMWFLFNLVNKSKILKIIVLSLAILAILLTSTHQKYSVNTAIWPPGGFWTSNEELQGYLYLKNLPSNTKVFTFSNPGIINGLDKFICNWCNEDRDFMRNRFNETADKLHSWMKDKDYKYLVIDGQTARIHGSNETNNKLNELLNSGFFEPEHSTNGFILLKRA